MIWQFIMSLKNFFDGNKQIVIFFQLPEMCVKILKKNIATSASFCSRLYIHTKRTSIMIVFFIFVTIVFYIYVYTGQEVDR